MERMEGCARCVCVCMCVCVCVWYEPSVSLVVAL